MGTCLQDESIERFVVGSCDPDERKRVEDHLVVCARCGERVDETLRQLGAYIAPGTTRELDSREGSVAHDAAGLLPEIPGYHILRKLHRGGHGVVYQAEQVRTQQKVALKVILEGPHATEKSRRQFERETKLLAGLHHPNIVTVFDAGVADGWYYLAMEYVRGEPLNEHVRSKGLTLREKMVLFGKVCAAVTYAHQNQVIHCDLKPGNILVTNESEPRVLDFGLAKATGPRPPGQMVSITGRVFGTLAYMAPEQAAGHSRAIDMRTDVYSLGVILYEMLTGERPYDVDCPQFEALRRIQEVQPPRPSTRSRQIDSEIEAIVMKALEKEPDHRYRTASELWYDVDAWLTGLPIVAKSMSSLYLIQNSSIDITTRARSSRCSR